MLEGWAAKTPPDFRFALKAPQRITHFARLRGVSENLDYFIATAGAPRRAAGTGAVPVAAGFGARRRAAEGFLDQLNGRVRAAFEFRNRSWFADAVLDSLRRAEAALCIAESDKMASPVETHRALVYLRLRRRATTTPRSQRWAERISIARTVTRGEVYVYFKHEPAAPELAETLPGAWPPLNGAVARRCAGRLPYELRREGGWSRSKSCGWPEIA